MFVSDNESIGADCHALIVEMCTLLFCVARVARVANRLDAMVFVGVVRANDVPLLRIRQV